MAAAAPVSQYWWLSEIGWLWLATIIIVFVASIIHYAWATTQHKKLTGKYKRRSPDTDLRDWHLRRRV
jgi:hypothetical protein